MATYVISDIHGHYEKFEKILKKIDLKDGDTLYGLGDILDKWLTPGSIYKGNNHIAIDCGCNIPRGRLAAICLDTWEEYYV